MLDELNPFRSNELPPQVDQVAAFSERIAVVGKARAAAGALQLLRIFAHHIIVNDASQPSVLSEIFTYRDRDTSIDTNVAVELLRSLIHFLTAGGTTSLMSGIPEMYDTAVLSLQLLLVMLSTQLYQPMISSLQQCEQPDLKQNDFFLDIIMEEGRRSQRLLGKEQLGGKKESITRSHETKSNNHVTWTPKSILSAFLSWQIQRPSSPERSIARYHLTLAQSVVAAKGEKVGPDGMYESNLVVSAAAPKVAKDANKKGESNSSLANPESASRHQPSYILDATKGVLIQASSIIMLPFKLMSLALGLFGANRRGFENSRKLHFSTSTQGTNRTRDVLLITESPIADLATSVLLVLANNRRVLDGIETDSFDSDTKAEGNPFQIELAALADNRWESGHDSLPDLPGLGQPAELSESLSLLGSIKELQEPLPGAMTVTSSTDSLMINFEALFLSFGNILHTEVGALALYTLVQSSKSFAETIASRTDLDALVMPLLRTLYFSSSSRHVSALDFQEKSSLGTGNLPSKHEGGKSNGLTPLSIRTCPFRSQSQLYLIVILLLLLSQDASFGSDAFRRTIIPSVPWYKERYLKDISLGSVMLLTLLRSVTFNLNRLHDVFLLSNCCAVIMNLSHAPLVDLHEYAAMRLASVTVSCLKKYVSMAVEADNVRKAVADDAGNQLLDMYAEVSHALLRAIKTALAQNSIERNLHLVYALVYHQADIKKIFAMKNAPFKKSEINRIHNVIKTSAKIIESQFNARTATKALQVLADNVDQLQEAAADKKKKAVDKEDFRFTYEEESDPESFFVPYIWEVIVCAVSASSIEWNRDYIQVFPLLEAEVTPNDVVEADSGAIAAPPAFASDIMNVV